MSTKTATRGLTVFFCILVVFLACQMLFSSKSESPSATLGLPADQRAVETDKPKSKREPEKRREVQKPEPSEGGASHAAAQSEAADDTSVDRDQEFMMRIASLPLDRANLETRREVERRLKASEKDRAKLILSEETGGKLVMAYAVKQPSMQEIAAMTKPYKMLLDSQTDLNAKQYVDKRYQNLFSSYGLTDGKYRLLYAIIPDTPESGPIREYSAAASSEQDCAEILRQQLAPKPPIQMGVPFSDGPGLSGISYEVLPGDWRMDHLVQQESLVPFYNSSRRSQLSNVDRPTTGE